MVGTFHVCCMDLHVRRIVLFMGDAMVLFHFVIFLLHIALDYWTWLVVVLMPLNQSQLLSNFWSYLCAKLNQSLIG